MIKSNIGDDGKEQLRKRKTRKKNNDDRQKGQ